MSIFDDPDLAIAKRVRVLFFLIDASANMAGAKIAAVNVVLKEVIPDLKEMAGDNADTQIKIAVMRFSTEAEWITASGPVEIEQFSWEDIRAGGDTNLGVAYKELNIKLSKNAFLQEAGGSFAPVIFLFSGGSPTDDIDSPINELWGNKWFKHSVKAAVAIGDDADKDVLEHFTGNADFVVDGCSSRMIRIICEDALKVYAIANDQVDAFEKARRMDLKEKLDKIREDNTKGDW